MKITRHLTQLAFVVLTLVAVFVVRGNAERWCPFGGVEAIYTYATQGNFTCSLAVSNFFIMGAVIAMTLLLRRAFCGYACPVGAISEWLQLGARKVGIKPVRVPYTLDRVLSLLKYPLLVFILYITWTSSELLFRAFDPCYALISRHGKDITFWAYVAGGGIVLFSLLIMLPFCRWLCPLAAVINPFSRVGLTRVRRDRETCVDCGICTQVCPMGIRVDREREVTAARCTACLDCVEACPKVRDGALSWGPPRMLGNRWPQIALIGIMLACIGGAVAATYAFPLPSFVSERGERPAEVASVDLQVSGVSCRGTSAALVNWLNRDDEYGLRGFVKIEAWPDAEWARVRVTYDPARTDADDVRRAIAMPYFDFDSGTIEDSPYMLRDFTLSADDL